MVNPSDGGIYDVSLLHRGAASSLFGSAPSDDHSDSGRLADFKTVPNPKSGKSKDRVKRLSAAAGRLAAQALSPPSRDTLPRRDQSATRTGGGGQLQLQSQSQPQSQSQLLLQSRSESQSESQPESQSSKKKWEIHPLPPPQSSRDPPPPPSLMSTFTSSPASSFSVAATTTATTRAPSSPAATVLASNLASNLALRPTPRPTSLSPTPQTIAASTSEAVSITLSESSPAVIVRSALDTADGEVRAAHFRRRRSTAANKKREPPREDDRRDFGREEGTVAAVSLVRWDDVVEELHYDPSFASLRRQNSSAHSLLTFNGSALHKVDGIGGMEGRNINIVEKDEGGGWYGRDSNSSGPISSSSSESKEVVKEGEVSFVMYSRDDEYVTWGGGPVATPEQEVVKEGDVASMIYDMDGSDAAWGDGPWMPPSQEVIKEGDVAFAVYNVDKDNVPSGGDLMTTPDNDNDNDLDNGMAFRASAAATPGQQGRKQWCADSPLLSPDQFFSWEEGGEEDGGVGMTGSPEVGVRVPEAATSMVTTEHGIIVKDEQPPCLLLEENMFILKAEKDCAEKYVRDAEKREESLLKERYDRLERYSEERAQKEEEIVKLNEQVIKLEERVSTSLASKERAETELMKVEGDDANDSGPAADRAATPLTTNGIAPDLFLCLSAHVQNARDNMREMQKSIERSCRDVVLVPYDEIPDMADLFLLKDRELVDLEIILGTELRRTPVGGYFDKSFVDVADVERRDDD